MRHRAVGSSWGKWDLHVHTPSSFDYANKGISNKEIIESLCAVGLDVVAVTDHHVIDVARVRELQTLAAERLTVLPGIEFRTELGGKETVHLVGIFSEECDLDDVWTKLSGKLELTTGDIQKKGGDEKVYVDFKETASIIHDLGGVVSVHAGEKTNTIENIGNNEKFKMTLKTDLVRDCIDIYEIGKVGDIKGYLEKVFPAVGMVLPLVICSDSHNAKQYAVKSWCWIKGDPCFRTFQQMISDPIRAFIGDAPRELERVHHNKTKYIEHVRFTKAPASSLPEDWFSGTIPINTGLVAIIGNKGTGKTALAEAIGLLGNCELEAEFSFLNKDKFRQLKNNKAKHFTASMRWVSEHEVSKLLSSSTQDNEARLVSYIPQNYLESICNEVVNITGSRFDLELKSVIFSHVNEADKIGAQSLDELLEFKTAPIKERIVQLRAELSALNAKLVALQQEASPEQKQLLLNLIATKERELEAHDKIKPVDVPKPEADPVTKAEMDTISALITQKNLERDKASQRIRDAEAAKRVAALRSAVADRILSTISNFEAHFETFLANLSNDCLEIGIDPAQLVRFESNVEPVQTELALAKKLSVDKDAEIGILNTRLASLKDEIANLSVKLDSPNREYQTFVEALREWNAKRAEIVGDEESADTITYLNNRVTHLAELPAMIADTKVRRETKVREIYHSIETLVAIYKSLYLPVQGFIGQHALSQDNFRLNFDARIISSELEMKFSERINQGRKGSFCGLDEGKKILRHLVESTDFQKEDAAIEFCSLLLDHLTYDHRYSPKVPATVTEQLKSGTNEQQLLDFIFGLEYLVPKYQLQWSGKDLDELSPGERGTLLLVFYLLIDKRDIPLVIDQPEENLDNQTVYNVLVPCLREARERRQVIIVTHNPNLAIVCDADQVIHCHMDKKNRNKVTYTSGAIENPAINRLTIDVLEGTRPAFDRRDSKYQTEPVVAAHKAAP